MSYKLLVLLVFLLWPVLTLGVPSINENGVSGTWNHGETVIITGSEFGTKSTPNPWLWDDLSHSSYSGLSSGDPIPTRDGAYGHPQDPDALWAAADASEAYGGTVYETSSAYTRVTGRPVYRTNSGAGWLKPYTRASDTYLFLDFWIYANNIIDDRKIVRLAAGDGDDWRAICHLSMTRQRTTYDAGIGNGDGGESDERLYFEATPNGQWQHISIWTDGSGQIAPPNPREGVLKIWLNNVPAPVEDPYGYDDTEIYRIPGASAGLSYINAIGLLCPECANSRFGDIYIDDTLSRVVLADDPVWANVRHYEMQIPILWDTENISLTVNTGSFVDSAFLFVIDSSGSVNSSGYPITIGSGTTVVPTVAPPTNLQISQ